MQHYHRSGPLPATFVASQLRRAFTLVEVLIVVMIMGILASVVLPQFTAASGDAKESALLQSLATMRNQIQMFRFQHEGRLPGTKSGVSFDQSMLQKTDIDGSLNTNGAHGPYILGQLPPNPYNDLRDVTVKSAVLAPADADGTTGWLYSTSTGEFRANYDGTMSDGSTIFSQ